jgi:ComF family protein
MVDFLALILPKRCVFCRKPCPEGLCADCRTGLPWRKSGASPVVTPLYYRDTVRLALHRYKFHGALGYAKVFAELMLRALEDGGVRADAVTWIPCSLFRRWSRGYDQSEKLARAIAGGLQLPVQKLLNKKRHSRSQTRMTDDRARRRNVRGAFAASPEAFGKRILLIDDIYTSGATMEECRGVLLKAGALEVVGCVLAAK